MRLGCWHADMPEEALSQVARMVLDHNLPSHTLAYPDLQEHPEARFVHPDDTRHQPHVGSKVSDASHGRTPAVLVSTDAAMQMVPKVRQKTQLQSIKRPTTAQMKPNVYYNCLMNARSNRNGYDTL